MPRTQETCTISVKGQTFKNWNQVEVTITMGETNREAGFVTTEIDSPSGGLRIMPDDEVTITMAGELVFTGYVNSRTASYDKGRHSVLILAKGANNKIARGAVSDYKTGGQLKSVNFKQMSDPVMKAQGRPPVQMVGNGKGAQTKFSSVQHIPGERAFRYLDRYARTAGITLHEDANGRLLAFTDPNMQRPGGELVEGFNILRASAKITDENSPGSRTTYAQNKADDKSNMRKASQVASNSKPDTSSTGGGGSGGGGNQPGPGGGFGGGSTAGGGSIGSSEPKAGVPQPGDEQGEDPVGGPSSSGSSSSLSQQAGIDDIKSAPKSGVQIGGRTLQPEQREFTDPMSGASLPGGPEGDSSGGGATSGHSEGSSESESSKKKPDELQASEVKHDNVDQSKNRTKFGDMWTKENYEIIAEIVVQGWQRSDGRVWNCADSGGFYYVQVDAPLLALTQQLLIKKVVLSQTNEEGSITTLTLGNRSSSGQSYSDASNQQSKTSDTPGGEPVAGGKPIGQGGIGHA